MRWDLKVKGLEFLTLRSDQPLDARSAARASTYMIWKTFAEAHREATLFSLRSDGRQWPIYVNVFTEKAAKAWAGEAGVRWFKLRREETIFETYSVSVSVQPGE